MACLIGDCSLSLFSQVAVGLLFSAFILNHSMLVLAMVVEDLIVLPHCTFIARRNFHSATRSCSPVAPHRHAPQVCGPSERRDIFARQRPPRRARISRQHWFASRSVAKMAARSSLRALLDHAHMVGWVPIATIERPA